MNKELVSKAFAEFTSGNLDVLRTVLHEDFVEHSPGNPSGRDAFVEFISRSSLAQARFELRRVIADGDLVAVHYRLTPADGPELAVIDIWRLADGLVVEHWDVKQPVPDDSLVPHGMF